MRDLLKYWTLKLLINLAWNVGHFVSPERETTERWNTNKTRSLISLQTFIGSMLICTSLQLAEASYEHDANHSRHSGTSRREHSAWSLCVVVRLLSVWCQSVPLVRWSLDRLDCYRLHSAAWNPGWSTAPCANSVTIINSSSHRRIRKAPVVRMVKWTQLK